MTDNEVLSSLKPLIAKLIGNFSVNDYDLRRESAIALSKFKGKKATDFLLETYESDNIQDFMALALGNIESSKAVNLLINALNDSQQDVRFNAARALGMLENPEALDILLEALTTYADNSSSNISSDSKSIDEHVSQIFFEEDAIIGAIIAVGKIKSTRALGLLKRLLNIENNPRIKASIIMALGMVGSDKLMPLFQNALRDSDPRVRANAIEAIEQFKSSSIVGILQPYLDDPNNRVKANVAKAIWKYGDYEVSDSLIAMLECNDKWQRASAAYAIGETHDAKFLRLLIRTLRDEDPDVRRNATNAIRKLELKSALPHLKPMLNDPNFDVRVEAALAITRCAPKEAYGIISDKLPSEENFIVQATLISCLGQLGSVETVRLLIRYLDSDDSRVVSNTIDALVKLTKTPDRATITKLETLLSHEDNRVKSTAIRTLWFWGQYDVLDSLLKLFNSEDKKHVLSAIFVFGEIGRAISDDYNLSEKVNNILVNLLDHQRQKIAEKEKEKQKAAELEEQENSNKIKLARKTSKKKRKKKSENKTEQEHCVSENETNALQTESPEPQINDEENISDELEQDFNEQLTAANNLILKRDYESAEQIYKTIYTTVPKHLKNLMAYANLCFMLKRYVDSEELYHKVLEINPNIVKALFNLGTICFYTKKYEEAINYLARALALYPKILGAYLILAQIYEIAGRYNESIKLLSHAITLSPRNPVIYQKLSLMHIQLNDYESAIQVLTRALEMSPSDIDSRIQLAYCLNFSGKHKEAFAMLDSAIKVCAASTDPMVAYSMLNKAYVSFFKILSEQ